MSEASKPNGLPSYDPQGTESVHEIPARFLVDGFLKFREDGAWLFKGDKIKHFGLQRFLARQLRRTEEGTYWVVNGPQRALVELEDAPFVVKRVLFDGEKPENSAMTAQLNDGSEEPLTASSLFMSEEGVLYTHVKQGKAGAHDGESHLARVTSEALLDLESLLVEQDDGSIALRHQGQLFSLG